MGSKCGGGARYYGPMQPGYAAPMAPQASPLLSSTIDLSRVAAAQPYGMRIGQPLYAKLSPYPTSGYEASRGWI